MLPNAAPSCPTRVAVLEDAPPTPVIPPTVAVRRSETAETAFNRLSNVPMNALTCGLAVSTNPKVIEMFIVVAIIYFAYFALGPRVTECIISHKTLE
jgi:hypothetical protein